MSDPQDATSVADREAAEWHVRLGERPVSADALAAFKAWRAVPVNAEAYQRLEVLWREAATLSADPDLQALTRDALRRSRPGKRRMSSTVLFSAGGVVAAAAVVALALSVWIPNRDRYATEVGEQRLIRLDDGSQIRLDTATRLRVRYGDGERRILLDEGQALFMVAHDAQRPFTVEAGATRVTALGTTFDVRRADKGARVTLVTGSVAVTEDGERPRRWRLEPGQKLETARNDTTPRPVDTALETSWSQGRLVFRNTPLRDAVAEVNRYLPDKIVLGPGAPEGVAVSGVFVAGDREAFVAAASDLFDLRAQPASGGGVRLIASSAGG